MENFKKISAVATDFYKSLLDTFTQKILPALKEVYGKVEQSLFAMYQETIDLLSAVFERTIKALKVFEEDFNKVGKVFSEVFKNFASAAAKWIEVLRKEVKDIYDLVLNYVKTFPGLDFIKEKYEAIFAEYKIPETILSVLKDLTSLLRDSLPTKEIADLIDTTMAYIEKKLTNKDVNDLDSIKTIYLNFVKAVHSVMSMVKAQFGEAGSGHAIAAPIPFSLEALKRLPYITSINFSPFNYFKNEKMLSIRELIANYRPYGFDPMSVVPPFTMHGQIADGQHIFTFDGRHMTFPGTCNYILAQDFVNHNFSIIAHLDNGKMKSITLIDKTDSVEINQNGVATLNGKPADLPIHKNDIHSWRDYHTISIFTSFGASVQCSTDLRVCHFSVSGFYLGKTRGLLGNGNSEPFDDYQLPNGKIAENFADFGNAYKSTKSCKPVAFDDHAKHAHSNEHCTKFFSSDSPLRYGFFFVDQTNYREACEHAADTSADKLDAACNIAEMYASSCRKEQIPVNIPSECKKCASKVDVGDAFSVKSPNKQADVIFIVDTELGSLIDDLVQNTLNDLRKELKARDITDIEISVIGYSKSSKYISKYTHNGKFDYTGKLSAIKNDAGPKEFKALKTGNDKIDEILEKLHENYLKTKEDVGLAADARAFQAAMEYPFRPSASKTIIAIRSDNLETTTNPIKTLWTAYASETVKEAGVSVHVITPVRDLVLSGKDAKNLKNVVGFNSKSVLVQADFKKRTNIGSTDMRANLKYTTDLGIDTVQDADGYIFVLQNYSALKNQKEKKNFITVVTASVADLMARTENTLDCKCELKNGLYPTEVCEVTDTKLLPPIVSFFLKLSFLLFKY